MDHDLKVGLSLLIHADQLSLHSESSVGYIIGAGIFRPMGPVHSGSLCSGVQVRAGRFHAV